jgi:hypothetical protein
VTVLLVDMRRLEVLGFIPLPLSKMDFALSAAAECAVYLISFFVERFSIAWILPNDCVAFLSRPIDLFSNRRIDLLSSN